MKFSTFLSAALPLHLFFVMSAALAQPRPSAREAFEAPHALKAGDSRACLRCHGMANFSYRESATAAPRNLSVNARAYAGSVHATIQCTDCHPAITQYPHAQLEPGRRATCGSDCHVMKNGKPYSHTSIFHDYGASVHGAGLTGKKPDAPTCLHCHGKGDAHAVTKAVKALGVREKMNLCTGCHDDHSLMARNKITTEAVASYKRSFHYKAIRFGEENTAVCQDCHSVHSVLPRDSARSTISPGNISRTCGQEKCHPGAEMNFAMSGANHLGLRIEKDAILRFEELFFYALTAGSMLMLVIGIILDIQKKFGWLSLILSWLHALARSVRGLVSALRPGLRWAKRILID